MNKSAYALVLVAVLFIAGCQPPPNSGVPPTTATANKAVSNAVQIVFTNAPPTNVVTSLQAVGAQPDSTGLVFRLPAWDFHNQQQEAAIEAALRAGATLKKGTP